MGLVWELKTWQYVLHRNRYKNINKTQKVKKLEKGKLRLQRSILKRYYKNKKGESYCKTETKYKIFISFK